MPRLKNLTRFALIAPIALATFFAGTVQAQAASDTVYVSATGNDTTGDGTAANPYATLPQAVQETNPGGTVLVMTDLTLESLTRVADKSVTITSVDPAKPVTLSRGATFATASDNQRSWYNPALLEVARSSSSAPAPTLTLAGITLDDKGITVGTVWGAAQNGAADNLTRTQDAMVAAYDTNLVLGPGTKLLNQGGISAVRAAGGSVTMQSGALITSSITYPTAKKPIGIWSQGSRVDMQAGAEIKDTRNIEAGILAEGTADVTVAGTLSGLSGTYSPIVSAGAKVTIAPTGVVSNNAAFAGGGVYCRSGCDLTVAGTITGNRAQVGGGGIYLVTNGASSHARLLAGGAITNNRVTDLARNGGGVEVQQGTSSFTMEGGVISGNSAGLLGNGGAISIHKGGNSFTMLGGEIRDNTGLTSPGIAMLTATPIVTLQGGVIENNTSPAFGERNIYLAQDVAAATPSASYVELKNGFVLRPDGITLQGGAEQIFPERAGVDVKVGNASKGAKDALTADATTSGLSTITSSFWYLDSASAAGTNVSNIALKAPANYDPTLPLYAAFVNVDATGEPVQPAKVEYVTATVTGKSALISIPKTSATGASVSLLQARSDMGSLTLTTPDELTEHDTKQDYELDHSATVKMSQAFITTVQAAATANDTSLKADLDLALDPRLVGSDFTLEKNGVFELDAVKGSTVSLKLASDWVNGAKNLAVGDTLVFKFTGKLPAADFAENGVIDSRAVVQFTGNGIGVKIPSGIATTKMVKDTAIGGKKPGPDGGGSNSGGGPGTGTAPGKAPVSKALPGTGSGDNSALVLAGAATLLLGGIGVAIAIYRRKRS